MARELLHNKLRRIIDRRSSPPHTSNDGRRVQLTLQLCTSVSYYQPEHTNRLARFFLTIVVSLPAVLSLAQLKRLTTFIDGQDGSCTQKQLLPLMRGALSVRGGLPPTEDSVAEALLAV